MNYNQSKDYTHYRKNFPPEDERIYLNVPYMEREFAKDLNCKFDGEKKLWLASCYNEYIYEITNVFGVNEATSEKAKALLKSRLDA